MVKSKNGKIVILSILILFVAIVLLLDIFVFTNKAYAAEEKVGEVVYNSSEWEDGSIGIMTRPQDTTVEIYRTGKNKYIMKATTDLIDYGFGVWCEWDWYVDGQKIDTKTFKGTAWNKATYTSKEFTHSDNTSFTVHFYWHVNSGFLNGYKTTGKKTISAYDSVKPTLSGVTSGSIINQDVKIESSDNRSGSTIYYKLKDGEWISTKQSNFTFSNEGSYIVRAKDGAENISNEISFIIDKTAPVLTLSGVIDNGFTNGNVSATWLTSLGGVGAPRVSEKDTLTVKYSYITSGGFPTSAVTNYTAGTNLTEAGYYLLEIYDSAGNRSQYRFIIDKTVPTLTLSGVINNGFTNGSVSSSWSTTVGDINAPRVSEKDTLTVKYSYNTSGGFPTSAVTNYTTDTRLTIAGNYLVEISDSAGNKSRYRFTIDCTAPILTLSGVINNGFTNGSVTALWDTTIGGVNSQLSNENDSLTVMYSFNNSDGTFPTSAQTRYYVNTELKSAGNYYVTISDRAGNVTSYKFTIDRTAPTLTLVGVQDGEMTNENVKIVWSTAIEGVFGQLANNKDNLSVKYSYLGGLDFPTSTTKEYLEGNLSNEGNYLIEIYDSAGNKSQYRFTIDTTAPNIITMPDEYTNKQFEYAADDLHGVVSIEYQFDDGDIQTKAGSNIMIEAKPENNGVWQFRAIDSVGNSSSWQKVRFLVRSGFGNLTDVRNEYKVTSWYTVTLLQKNFPTAAGKYSFENYNAALAFAIQKEWDYRVVTLSNGTWSYASISNPSITQIYTKRSELDVAVHKYAAANVSDRNVLKTSGGGYNTPVDDNGIERSDALTKQNISLPDILSDYADLALMLINHNYVFRMPQEVLSGNIATLSVRFLSDGITLQSGGSNTYLYGNSIKTMLEQDGNWQQGYYLVTETDLCGNTEQYIVFLDIDTPSITAKTESGDGTSKTIIFDAAYTDKFKDVMLYTGLNLERIKDNMDEYAILMIDGRGLEQAFFLDGDELPDLRYENGYYGKYTITIYDRSKNILSFTVTIAGAPPTIEHSSLTNETRCRIRISVTDKYNTITSIRFFKVTYTGEYVPMSADDDGIAIEPGTLDYSLRTGGKYVVIITDIFGREIQSEPLFYMKGLPTGMLSGVRVNGVTNKTVTFRYENTNKILVYIFSGGNWITADNRVTIDERSGYNYATIIANEQNSYQYKIFLYKSEDMNLFVEYIFEIDSIPPSVEIITDEGKIEEDEVTRLPFRVNWNEYGIKAYYYNKNSALGELAKSRYNKDLRLTEAGTYVFEIADEAGNMITFNVTIDNFVSYSLDGNYSILSDGSYISKNSIILTVTEATLKWTCESSNGIVPENGQKITIDGTYKMHIEDMYGNVLELTIIIDNLPPEPVIKTTNGDDLSLGAKTNQAFTVKCDETAVVISYSSNGKNYVTYDGAVLDTEGTHYFKLTDRMGNTTSFVIHLDKTVDFEVSGKYIQRENGYLAQYITVTMIEEYKDFKAESNNGVEVELGKRITEAGIYTLTITDFAGNVLELVIKIDLTPPEPMITTESGKVIQQNSKTNEAFNVVCDEECAGIYLAVDSGFTEYDGSFLTQVGKYTFRVLDLIGNEAIFTVEIDGGIDYEITGKYVKDAAGNYVSSTWLCVNVLEEFVSFDVVSDNGRTFKNGEKVIHEGKYSVAIVDVAGNVITLDLIIDMTPPEPYIQTSSGVQLQPNTKTNESFTIFTEELATIELSRNGQSYVLYGGTELSEAAKYYFRIMDKAGNSYIFTVELDSGVDFEVSGNYKIDEQGRYVSATGLTVIINEDYRVFDVVSSNDIVFKANEKISEEGIYTIKISDYAGNETIIVLVIDKTPPKPVITTITGKEVQQNGKTNEEFTVKCNERGVTMYWSTRDGDYSLYDGQGFAEKGKHYFKLTDFVGNSNVFSIVVDKTVDYTIKGLYKTIKDHEFASNSGVALLINEEYSEFKVETDEGQAIVLGEKIVREGRYVISIVDIVGNVVRIDLHIDYTAPNIILSGVEEGGITGQSVTVKIDDFKTAYYQLYGSSERVAIENNSTIIKKTGQYTIVAEDWAGNRSSAAFTIDGDVSVAVSPNLLHGQIITGSIEFRYNEKMSSSLLALNGGEPNNFNGGKISEPGEYTLTVVDECGNTAYYSWTILPTVAQGYSIQLPQGYQVSVLKDGYAITDVVTDNIIQLNENGIYELTFSQKSDTYIVTLIVDTVKPTIDIKQEKSKIVIDKPNKDNLVYELTLNGKPVDFTLGKEITAVGEYVLTITDEYGNQSVYTFSLHYINGFGIAVIVIGSVFGAIIAITVIVIRRKQSTR